MVGARHCGPVVSSRKSEQKKKGTLSLIWSVRAVAVGEEEETIRERERSEASILCGGAIRQYLSNINKLLRNIDHRW